MRFRHYRGSAPPRFAHPAEEELAELLDEEGIPWEYEPHTFPLERSPDGTVHEAITPDYRRDFQRLRDKYRRTTS